MRTLWDDPEHAETRRRLIAVIARWRAESSVRTAGFTAAWR